MPPRFVLDQNFPTNIIQALGHIRDADLIPLREFDARLTKDVEDWEILLEIHKRQFDGFITSDDSMLSLPKELAILIDTRLTLVVTVAVTHDPLAATGLMLIHLPHIAHQSDRDIPQLWELRMPRRNNHADPWDQLRKVADRRGDDYRTLYKSERVIV